MEVLVVKLSAIGDVIHTLPAVDYLKRSLPGCRITWVVEPAARELLSGNPLVDRLVLFDKRSIFADGTIAAMPRLEEFRRQLSTYKYDAAIDFQGLFKSSGIACLSGARHRIGFARTRECADWLLTDKLDVGDYFGHATHVVDLNLSLARFAARILFRDLSTSTASDSVRFPLPEPDSSVEKRILELLSAHDQTAAKDQSQLCVLIPGTTWVTKIWPEERWIELGKFICDRLHMRLAIIGGAGEREVNERIAREIQKSVQSSSLIVDITGKTSLTDLISLFNQSHLVVGGDTGPLHLAAATQKPRVIGIYGSTPAGRNGPYGRLCHVVSLDLACQPCFSKTCRIQTLACLKDLSVEVVFGAIEEALKSQPVCS